MATHGTKERNIKRGGESKISRASTAICNVSVFVFVFLGSRVVGEQAVEGGERAVGDRQTGGKRLSYICCVFILDN